MADIAAEMKVSEAALYRYVESKEGLFRLVVRHALFQEDLPDEELPLASPPLDVTLKDIREGIGAHVSFPSLEKALRRRRVANPLRELEGLVRELFALTALTREATDMIERSAREVPELADLVNKDLRRPLLDGLQTYLERRARAGQQRRTPDAAATARFVLETVTWFARHRFSDPDGAAIPDEVAEQTVVDMLVHALVPAGPAKKTD
jgi:AcrR family transcriptional regulator